MSEPASDRLRLAQISLWEGWLGDGRFPLGVVAFCLAGSGAFALFLCFTGHFLPHDVVWLGADARMLERFAGKEVVAFMFHDRAAFGGALLAIGILYGWLIRFPLTAGDRWAWWTLAVSGGLGFASFLTYLGYGYLDTWHGAATLALLPLYIAGLIRARSLLSRDEKSAELRWLGWGDGLTSAKDRWGRRLLTGYGAGMILAGLCIASIGMTEVFVPQDLAFMKKTRLELCSLSGQLVPLIAHDRAGFGGGLVSIGAILLGIVGWSAPSRGCREALLLSGISGFACAIGVHWVIGYTDLLHLAPAYAGAGLFAVGMILFWREGGRSANRARAVQDGPQEKLGQRVGQEL